MSTTISLSEYELLIVIRALELVPTNDHLESNIRYDLLKHLRQEKEFNEQEALRKYKE